MSEEASLIVIALRGTQAGDWRIYDPFTTLATRSFMRDYRAYTPFVRFQIDVINGFNDYITRNNFSQNVYILITGHSLGGAATQLISAAIQESDWSVNSKIFTYTIGSPNPIANVTGTGVAGSFDNIFNIVNPGGDHVIDLPDARASKFGLVLAIPSMEEWGRTDNIAAFIDNYAELMDIDSGQIRRSDIGSHKKESYIAWIITNPYYGSKVSIGFPQAIYSPNSPFP